MFRVLLMIAMTTISAGLGVRRAGAIDPTQERLPATVAAPQSLRFTRDVIPALTKAGCNAGACHGSFRGRGGFTLSLLGFDAPQDFDTLTKASRGRRLNLAIPDQSLLLRKATGELPHGGGARITWHSEVATVLRAWLQNGAPGPRADDLAGLVITVTPAEVTLALSGTAGAPTTEGVPLRVAATFGDGTSRDVTRWALFDVRDKTIAAVTREGLITAVRSGKTAVTVRYLGAVASIGVSVPFGPAGEFDFPSQNFIDQIASAEWRRLGTAPSRLADDGTFLRRIYVDLIGTLPTDAEARSFLADPAPTKRFKVIDALLERAEYVDYWSLKWGDLLRAHRRYLGDKGLASLNSWIRQSVRDNKPLDEMTRELLTAQGNLFTNGPVAYYFIDEKVEDLAETTAQVFLGVRLQCTKCHHHPNEVWSQQDYYGLAAFFSRLDTKDSGALGSRFGGPKSIRLSAKVNPNRKPQMEVPPQLFGLLEVTPTAVASAARNPSSGYESADPRAWLAAWITRRDNPYFARNFVNRYWAALFGVGLVEPVDDMRATNPATLPKLLDALAADFADQGYDAKRLLRTICNSRVYQLATELDPQRDEDGRLFTHRAPRRLPAEVLLDAINQVTGSPETFAGQPAGTRAIALPDPSIASQFLTTFGRPQRNSPCDCARGSHTDLSQTLHLVNSTALQDKIAAPTGTLAQQLQRGRSDDEILDALYLSALSRWPGDDDRRTLREALAAGPTRSEVWQDVVWAVLNCSEFVFDH